MSLSGDLGRYRADLERSGLVLWADQLVAGVEPSVRLRPDEDVATEPLGTSRLGGRPDLSADAPWPRRDDGQPLSFIAQIDLAQVASLPGASVLPVGGVLSFFFDDVEQPWGFDPMHRDGSAVVFTAPDADLVRRDPPPDLPSAGVFGTVGLAPRSELTVPPWDSSDVDALGLTFDETLTYGGVTPYSEGTAHRLLGHPDPIQGDMQLECQLASHGISIGGPMRPEDTDRRSMLTSGAIEWRLLLQIDSSDDIGMMWGDDGRLYWWMTRTHLAARDWAQAWAVLQCS